MNKTFYITTSIAYVNAAPHLGFALETIQADSLARYYRARGFDTRFLSGTDEHGAKIVRTAASLGRPVREFVDENAAKFQALKDALNLSWNDFIRTSDQKRHWPAAQKLWMALYEKGDLYKKIYRGLYCIGHEAFVTEKDLAPTSSSRSSDQGIGAPTSSSRGSDRSIGVNLICRDHQKAPEIIEEENWFFKLSKYAKIIESRIENNELRIVPETRKNEILALFKEGLEDVSFSRPNRDLSWGVPVPNDPTQTMYVWADALSNYLSALGYWTENDENFKKYWPADVHLIGKDILRFHAAIWPAMLLSVGLKLPKAIFVHGHITIDGQKMSKTVGNVIDPFELAAKHGSESVRYYLLREIPSGEDGDFSYAKFEERYNADLANGLGNFAARVLAMAEKLGEIKTGKLAKPADKKIKETHQAVEEAIENFKLHEALAAIWGLIHFGDNYVNENRAWENPESVYTLVAILDNVAVLLKPFLPEASAKITGAIQWSSKEALRVSKIGNLFPRL